MIFVSTLRQFEVQLDGTCRFKTGVAVSADLWLGGFDTHANRRPSTMIISGSTGVNLTNVSVDYLWDVDAPGAWRGRPIEMCGTWARILAVTNFYNAGDGKDQAGLSAG